jgi:hypothetical protein
MGGGSMIALEKLRMLPDHLVALQLLVSRCSSPEAKKDLIVTAGICDAIGDDEGFVMVTANQLETA